MQKRIAVVTGVSMLVVAGLVVSQRFPISGGGLKGDLGSNMCDGVAPDYPACTPAGVGLGGTCSFSTCCNGGVMKINDPCISPTTPTCNTGVATGPVTSGCQSTNGSDFRCMTTCEARKAACPNDGINCGNTTATTGGGVGGATGGGGCPRNMGCYCGYDPNANSLCNSNRCVMGYCAAAAPPAATTTTTTTTAPAMMRR